MVVEFIGSTGAGKTTVLRNVERRLANRTTTTTSADLVTGLMGLRGVTHPTVRNLIQELIAFPFLVPALHQHRGFVVCTLKLLVRDAKPSLITINNIRSLERKLGVYMLVRRIAGNRIVLVDEGPLLSAHMFVHAFDRLTAREIATFAQTLPLPDMIVHIRAPVDAVVGRTLLRPDPPRETLCRALSDLVRYAEAAAALFEQLVVALRGALPILTVDNPDMDAQHQQAVVETIAGFIINHSPKVCRTPIPSMTGMAASGVGQHRTNAR